jgi:serine/threonine-protein kinase
MSPEQVRNAKQVDARSDIWSLGVILHELLTGSPAFHAETLPGICAAIIADDPAPLRSLREDVSPELEAVVTKCLEKSVNSRFQTVRELMTALRGFGSSKLQLSSRPIVSTMRESGNPSSASGRPQETPAKQGKPATPSGQTARSAFELSATPVASSQEMTSIANDARKRRTMAILASAAVAVVAVTFFARLYRSERAPSTPASGAPELRPTARKSFTLVVDSTPSGAEVLEGDKMLGITPMQISIDNDAARSAPRKLIVRREGFQPYSIFQGPSEDNVRVIASLIEAPAEPTTSASRGRPPVPAPVRSPKPAKSATAEAPPPPMQSAEPTPPPVDIRLQR